MLHHPLLYVTSNDVVSGIGVKSRSCFHRGDFIGFYTGTLVDEACYDAIVDSVGSHSFAIEHTGMLVVRRDERDIIGFVNEPPAGKVSNAVALPLHLAHGNAVAYYSCQYIPAHMEIWVHYGASFARDYKVGIEGNPPRRIQRADEVVDLILMEQMAHVFCAARLG